MSQQLVIDNNTYLPSSVLARQFSYTPDYLGKLAREGKVEATRVGRQWYVTEDSVQEFVTASKQAKAKRSEELREARREERTNHAVGNDQPRAIAHQAQPLITPVERVRNLSAVVQTILVLTCGLLFGVSGYYASESGVLAAAAENTSAQLVKIIPTENYQPAVVPSDQSAAIDFSVVWHWLFGRTEVLVVEPPVPVSSSRQPAPAAPTQQNAMLMFDGDTATATVQAIQESFSDEVEVTFDGPNTGVLKPVFEAKTDESYRFLLVPVTPMPSK